MPARYDRIAFVASQNPEAQRACAGLVGRYGNADADSADVIVALGGDGLMLQTLHRFMRSGKPIYGMHRGTVGFLMNEFRVEGLRERLAAAETTAIHPLVMRARDTSGRIFTGFAAVTRSITSSSLNSFIRKPTVPRCMP